jgi:hypothetical protein
MKKTHFFIVAFSLMTSTIIAQVKVGNNPTTINSSSLLELESTDKALTLPRMTAAQMNAIASPVNGMMVYNTDIGCIFQRDAATWKNLCLADTLKIKNRAFAKVGATGATNDSSVSITDNIYHTGNVGIGTNNPSQLLTVNSSTYVQARLQSGGGSNAELALSSGSGREYRVISTGTADPSGAGLMSFYDQTAGAKRMSINSTGFVGIGTTTPAKQLHVTQSTFIGGRDAADQYPLTVNLGYDAGPYGNFTDNRGIAFRTASTATPNSFIASVTAGMTATVASGPERFLALGVKDSSKLVYIVSNAGGGSVGIGNTVPTNRLHITAVSNPLRIEGVQASSVSTDKNLVIDANGVVKTSASSSSSFSGYISANFSNTTTGTIEKIIVDNEQVDFANEYNTTTGLFTPAASGTYVFEIQITASQAGAINTYGDVGDACVVGLVDGTTNTWVGRFNFEGAASNRSYYSKGIVTVTGGQSYYFGLASAASGVATIVANPSGGTGSGIGTYFSISKLK